MLALVQSNHLEAIAAALATRLVAEPPAPLAAETIIIPAASVGRWLGFELARRIGIAANLEWAFPASFAWSLFARVLPEVPRDSPFDAGVMRWRLMRLLALERPGPEFTPVRHYLASGRLMQRADLARALAARFEAYAAYRPDWLAGWLAGERFGLGDHEGWQATLWRELAADAPHLPHAHPKEAFFAALAAAPPARAMLPERLTIFGVDAIAPLYLEIFERLASHLELSFYALNPCREYWGHIARPRAVAHAASGSHLETGNRLFASLGQHGRVLFDALAARDPLGAELFVEPTGDTLLATLQRDILELRERSEPIALAAGDRSIAFHACHGAVREAQVLHDQLLAVLDADPSLEPGDVLVLCPDLANYGPALDAVFGAVPHERAIPYSIADRPFDAERPIARVFFALLDCAAGRLDAETVIGLLDEPAIARRARLDASDPRLRDWVRESGIRWGEDAAARVRLGLPETPEHSWQAGLDRIVLGAALAPGSVASIGGVVPYADIEGAGMRSAGELVRFVQSLAALGRTLAGRMSIGAWSAVLVDALDRFLAVDLDDESDAQAIRGALAELAHAARTADFSAPVSADVVLRELRERLARRARAGAFLAGGVTIAALATGRIVPARIVCLVGMNDGVFPRLDRPHGFDLLAAYPRAGDPRARDEDRYAFLCALLAARERLIVSYVGASAQDNSPLPPSVAVGELIDAIRATAGGAAVAAITSHHPLQPFSSAYGKGALFTYATEWEALAAAPEATPFERSPGLQLEADRLAVSLEELRRFFRNPSRYFLRERLGLTIDIADRRLEVAEPFLADGLGAYDVRATLAEAALGTLDASDAEALIRGGGLLPHGAIGTATLDRERASVRTLAARVRSDGEPAWLEPVGCTIEIAPWTLTARLDRLTARGVLRWRVGRMRSIDFLHLWLEHLVLSIVLPDARESLYIGIDQSARCRPLGHERARALLADLLAVYAEGLQRLIPLYPRTSYEWARAERSRGDARRAARAAWITTAFSGNRGDSEDPYIALAVRGQPHPLDERFEAMARRVFDPLLDHLDLE